VLLDHFRNLGSVWTNVNSRARRRHNPIKLARKQQSRKPVGHEHQVRVAERDQLPELASRLIRLHDGIADAVSVDELLHRGPSDATANEQPSDGVVILEAEHGVADRRHIVPDPAITRILNDEPITKTPLGPKGARGMYAGAIVWRRARRRMDFFGI
jgi:hypothetical protein